MVTESEQEQLFTERLTELLETSIFDDIAFNCKDGKIGGNRLILSIYSNFMEKLFVDNPLIANHPLSDPNDNGINLPEMAVEELRLLLDIVKTAGGVDIKAKDVLTVKRLSNIFQIQLSIQPSDRGLSHVQAVPKAFALSKNGTPIREAGGKSSTQEKNQKHSNESHAAVNGNEKANGKMGS